MTTSAQQRSKHAQGGRNSTSDARHDQRPDQRPSNQPRPEQLPTTGLGTIGLPPIGTIGLPPIGLPPANARPYWEQKKIPAGERPHTPPFDLHQIPGWEQGNVARAMLDQQRNPRPANDRRNSKHYNKPGVVYFVPPY